jgi:hypothetical protein
MDIVRIKKSIIKLFAKVNYYGVTYLPDFIMYKLGIRDHILSARNKLESRIISDDGNYITELKKWFLASTGEELDLKEPKTFNQKIQWLKVYDSTPEKTLLADKYLVRGWIEKTIGAQYLVPLLGVWDNFDDIDFSKLPTKFALKCNHGSHWNIIVNDIKSFDKEKAKKKFDYWMSLNYAFIEGFEMHYKDIPPKIIAEEYMENSNGEMYDYKFFCFSGKVKYIQFLAERTNGLKMAYFDTNWVKQPFVNNHPMIKEHIPKPDNLREMIEIAEKLAERFSFVRVDLYRLNDGKILFGEMTFTPASGTQNWIPSSTNNMLGNLLKLPTNNER